MITACLRDYKATDLVAHLVCIFRFGDQCECIPPTNIETKFISAIRDSRSETQLVDFPQPRKVVRLVVADCESHPTSSCIFDTPVASFASSMTCMAALILKKSTRKSLPTYTPKS